MLYRRVHVDVLVCFFPVGLGHVVIGSTVKVSWWSICQQPQMLTLIQTWNHSHDMNGLIWTWFHGPVLLVFIYSRATSSTILDINYMYKNLRFLSLRMSSCGSTYLWLWKFRSEAIVVWIQFRTDQNTYIRSCLAHIIWTIWWQEHMVLINILMVTWSALFSEKEKDLFFHRFDFVSNLVSKHLSCKKIKSMYSRRPFGPFEWTTVC